MRITSGTGCKGSCKSAMRAKWADHLGAYRICPKCKRAIRVSEGLFLNH